MYRHLLVPLDGSEITTGLVRQALAYAATGASKITFFHAVRDYGATDEGALQRTLDPDAFERRSTEEADRILLPAQHAARTAGVDCDVRWKIADAPHAAIQSAAEESGCDLIFIASHSKRGFNRLFLGSQTSKVVTESTLPVLVVRVPH